MQTRSARAVLFMIVTGACSLASLNAATLSVSLNDNAFTLASTILGPGVTIVGTPTLSAMPGQSGVFANFNSGPYTQTGGASGMFVLPSGVILTTGIASGSEGNYIGGPSYDAQGSGDAMLSAISGSPTFDANVLTANFTTSNPLLLLTFIFASSEYPSFVGTSPSDPFAIFVNGQNVALVPGTSTPISINSINPNTNAKYFTQYSTPSTPFNYGGATTVLTASAAVSTSSVNTIRIAIADAGDATLDSALFVQAGSVAAVPEPATWLLSVIAAGIFVLFARFRRQAVSC